MCLNNISHYSKNQSNDVSFLYAYIFLYHDLHSDKTFESGADDELRVSSSPVEGIENMCTMRCRQCSKIDKGNYLYPDLCDECAKEFIDSLEILLSEQLIEKESGGGGVNVIGAGKLTAFVCID